MKNKPEWSDRFELNFGLSLLTDEQTMALYKVEFITYT